ncbi:transposase [Francisella sp. 19X1-34]|uniref:transposase n=1 Tax=Francisella sp. 19X1-34 TaxID=3087177 RepID=UPI002E2FC81F|nr:transposase [Francisella sp. 19X1-34]MED7789580.1 transposase [Francisella sp. 19X1-34]
MEHKRVFQRKNHRLENFDYSQDGYYYVTICTKERVNYFGEISSDGHMILNDCGKIVYDQWMWLSYQYEYVFLDEFVVMPNHFHGILIINNPNVCVEAGRDQPNKRTCHDMSLQKNRKIKSLSQLIGAFKTTSSKQIRNNLGLSSFQWQRSFYDHIIRDEQSLLKIREYINNNPAKWHLDKYNCENQNEH